VDRGLRGYPPRSLDGSRRLLVNAEFRPTLYARPAWVLAAAVFADGGSAWTPGESSPDFKMAVGAGGRLGLSKIYNTPVLRVDLARRTGDGVWQVSFGLGQYF
jgi:hemolysin activation/secretion protein